MLDYALKGLLSHKLRAAGTVLSVFLGVALVAGTYVLTDTINRSFDDIFTEAVQGTDVVISGRKAVQRDENDEPPSFSAGLLERVRSVEGVEQADGGIFSIVRIVDDEGEPVGKGFAPNFVISASPEPFDPTTYTSGRSPRATGEAALDANTAERAGLGLGDRVGVAGERKVSRYRIVGTNRLGGTSGGGSASVTLVLSEAQRVAGKDGELDAISVAAAGGVSPGQLKRSLAGVLPRTLMAETASENAERRTSEIGEDLAFLKVALLVFSGVSLVVGAFLIFNTFSITVAQRIREFGLLRTLGASRRQLLTSVVAEAGAIALAGSLLGVAGGVLFAEGINALFKSVGIDLPNTGTVIEPRTIVVSLALGLGMTLLAAIVPALRATRVTPMAALREAELPESRRRGRVIAAVAVVLGAGGLAMLLLGLFGGIESSSSAAGLMGGGSAAILFAVSLYSPRLVRPLASVAGRPIERLRGMTGRLARENAMRKPGRTAVTAAALMIGLALVVFVTVFAAAFSNSIAKAIDRNYQGDLTVQNTDGFSPISADAAEAVRRVEGVQSVSSLRFSFARVEGVRGDQRVSAVDPATVGSVLALDFERGSDATLRELRDDQAVIDQAWGESKGVEVGDTLRATTPARQTRALEVVASVKDNADLLGNFVVTQRAMARDFDETRDGYAFVNLADGEQAGVVQMRIKELLERDFPSAEVLDQTELKEEQESQIQQVLGLVYALLSLAIVVSIFGIVNTLALSIHERTRELGMLRAIGMSRRQVRRVIRYEAVITSLIGAILGTVLGVLFAALVSRPLADEGFALTFPIPTLLILLLLAALAGVVAAIAPARRASRLDVLEALAYE